MPPFGATIMTQCQAETATKQRKAGFTLIELLIVIALTGLLLALLLGPLIQAFGLTNRARALAEAQDATRFGIERLKRELSQAAYVYDNTNMPIVLPLDLPAGQEIRDPAIYPVQNGTPNPRPLISYAKIDFLPVATQGEGPATVIDPTTDKPLGGARLSLPGAPGRRMVRYFVGLRENLPRNAQPAYYRNVFEFPRTDLDLNPFILYRVEFNPNDQNLVNPAQTNPFGAGGLHDPNFFYNYELAPNGNSYAANWRQAANPILATTNLDVIAWRRGSDRQVVPGNPIQMLINFAPSTIVGDTATPGFLSNTQAEAPGAVPSLYTAKYGMWVYPFSITFFRGTTEFGGTAGAGSPFGTVRFTIEQVIQPNGSVIPQVQATNAVGQLSSVNYYWLMDSVNGKYHIFTDNLAFSVDPARGRIETAFPPLATSNGIPLFTPAGGGAAQVMNPGPVGNFGELVPLLYVRNTRDDDPNDEALYGEQPRAAGLTYPGSEGQLVVPQNQGIVRAELFDRGNNPFRYFPFGGGTAYASPFNVFGNAGSAVSFRGIMLVPGSEKVMGPDNQLSPNPNNATSLLQVTYYRVPAAVGSLAKKASIIEAGANRLYQWNAQMNYRVEADLGNFATPYLEFDKPATELSAPRDQAAGLPAVPAGSTGAQGILTVSFLWQNNYARNQAGQPINAQGQATTNSLGGNDVSRIRPEADVVKLDYATRAQMNVNVGARVYDTTTKTAQSAEVNDKVTVNNVSR